MKTKLLSIFTLIFMVACDSENVDPTSSTELIARQAFVDFSSEADINLGITLADENNISNKSISQSTEALPNCAQITFNNNNNQFPKTITVNFGTGCTINGVSRSGSLVFTFSGPVFQTGSTMTVERNNYVVNAVQVIGTITYENTTTSSQTPQWSRTINNGLFVFPSGFTIGFSDSRVVQLAEGAETVIRLDDVYKIVSGSRNIVRSNGSFLNITVQNPLIKKFVCPHISKGQLQLVGTNINGVLDYGENTCDNEATFTDSQGNVINITF